MTDTPSRPTPNAKRTNPLILFLMAAIPAAAIVWSMYQTQVKKPTDENLELNSKLVYDTLGRPGVSEPLKLADKFKDADGDLVADPATGADQVDPPTILFSYVGTSQTEGERLHERFKEFVAYLQSKTGKPVEFVAYTPEDEVKALCTGKLHVAGINTGNIPTAVNQCGFVPFCSLATDQGVATYQMQIIVPADSPIQKLEDLRGRELTLTEPGSNSGFKAPLVLLARDHNIKPGRDFNVRYSGGHEQSIEGIASKTYQAAAVAGDVLKRVMAEDPPKIKKEQFRVVYESENFPTAGFGYISTLKPDLAAKVKDAFFTFQWKGTGLEREFAASGQSKFIPVSFKNDFSLVRRIDDEIRSVRSDMEEPTTMQMGMETTQPATTAPAQIER